MYSLNYIDGIIVKGKSGNKFVRLLKILNLLVHIAIVVILVMSIFTYLDIKNYNKKIESIKFDIENKRTETKVSDVEKEWEAVYYKLLAVKEQMDKHTDYAYIFRDLGYYLPLENDILSLTFDKNIGTVFMTIDSGTLSELTAFYDYASKINSSFMKSSYLGHNVTIQDLEERKIDKKVVLKALKVDVSVNSRKLTMNNGDGNSNGDDSNNGEGSENNEQ